MTCRHLDVRVTGFRDGRIIGRCRGCRTPVREVTLGWAGWEVVE